MAKKKEMELDYSFFRTLWGFYFSNKGTIKKHYRDLTKKILDYNNPDSGKAFLRKPQFEALEMYVFLKEFAENKPVHDIFHQWHKSEDRFEGLSTSTYNDEVQNMVLFEMLPEKEYEKIFNTLKANAENYSNYIFALTMGTGKTILMATCIFYEFLLAKKFPQDKKYCHNALVFAPDKTVLQSLKEIMTFDKSRVIPPQYLSFLEANLKFHFLDDATTLDTIDGSKFNIIISNTQKVILKKKSKEDSASDKLFKQLKIDKDSMLGELTKDLWNFNEIELDDNNVHINQRFQKLLRLNQIGIYVDEAHHMFGKSLEADLLKSSKTTSLRNTINEIASNLEKVGTHVVACYNFTGTPYVNNRVLPEVVYAYGLKEAILNRHLKQVKITGYEGDIKSNEFIHQMIKEFWEAYNGNTYEGLLPKIAIFAPTVEDLKENLKPAVEEVLSELGIPLNKVLINVGDAKVTTNDDIRNFNNLDKVGSEGNEKQFILLVNKGQEGWNCRSLFSVGLYREPKSKIFVLQSTMRCLRQIGQFQETARVFLSEKNYEILEDELQANFNISINDINRGDKEDVKPIDIKIVPPIKKIRLKRVKHKFDLIELDNKGSVNFELDKIDLDKFKIIRRERNGLMKDSKETEIDISNIKENRKFSKLTLVAEISRYLNIPCLKIEKLLKNSVDGLDKVIELVNMYNEILYAEIIPKLFNYLFKIEKEIETIEEEIELIKQPKTKPGEVASYKFKPKENLVVRDTDVEESLKEKSFHVDTYCFDSIPEKELFWELLRNNKIKEVYFTGMFTGGQSDFYIQYVDPDSHTVRSYYPDFICQSEEGVWDIIEVKGDNMIDDIVVQAKKEYAEEMARENKWTYTMIKSSDIMNKSNTLQLKI